jgi:hypothetical protein
MKIGVSNSVKKSPSNGTPSPGLSPIFYSPLPLRERIKACPVCKSGVRGSPNRESPSSYPLLLKRESFFLQGRRKEESGKGLRFTPYANRGACPVLDTGNGVVYTLNHLYSAGISLVTKTRAFSDLKARTANWTTIRRISRFFSLFFFRLAPFFNDFHFRRRRR